MDHMGQLWATDDFKNVWVFHPLFLTVRYKLSLKSLFNFKEKAQIEIFEWIQGKVIIFDKVSGIGAVFYQFRLLLKFKEFIGNHTLIADWTYTIRISPNHREILAIVAGYHENRTVRYDVFQRRIRTQGTKEYDLAHNAVILEGPLLKTLVFESQIGRPLAKIFHDSKYKGELYLKEISETKFSKLFNFERGCKTIACCAGSTLALISVKDPTLPQLVKLIRISNIDDKSKIEHVEQLSQNYLIACTSKAFYRITIR